MTPYTLEEVEQDIYDMYQWFHGQNPNVRPQATGRLGDLWALWDLLMEDEGPAR